MAMNDIVWERVEKYIEEQDIELSLDQKAEAVSYVTEMVDEFLGEQVPLAVELMHGV